MSAIHSLTNITPDVIHASMTMLYNNKFNEFYRQAESQDQKRATKSPFKARLKARNVLTQGDVDEFMADDKRRVAALETSQKRAAGGSANPAAQKRAAGGGSGGYHMRAREERKPDGGSASGAAAGGAAAPAPSPYSVGDAVELSGGLSQDWDKHNIWPGQVITTPPEHRYNQNREVVVLSVRGNDPENNEEWDVHLTENEMKHVRQPGVGFADYVVDRVVSHEIRKGKGGHKKIWLKVRWLGYGPEGDTWQAYDRRLQHVIQYKNYVDEHPELKKL